MTEVVYHEYQKSDKNHIDHSYLIDVGEEIDIQQIMEYKWKVFDSVILKPPHPRTRYFELFITEYTLDGASSIDDLQVYPVLVNKKPDLRVLGFVLKRGDWIITERIYKKANTTEIQWIYSDDFHLFAITHAHDSLEHMVEEIVSKIDEIASSVKTGYRVYSHMENQRMRREAFDAVMESQSGITINKTAILKHPEFQLIAELGEGDRRKMQDEILQDLVALGATLDTFGGSNKIVAKLNIPEKTDINKQLAHIEELQDLGWLFE
ncbi:MAG: hypothetical protein Q7T80_01455 [Methanoregula sp.]|nr:hypothetical protein [Methanoregula sp.]